MGVNDPDWGRVGASPPSHFAALGDPTRWGATIKQTMPPIDGTVFRGDILSTDQVLSVQCRDRYPRAWTISGSISAPAALWTLPDGIALDNFASALMVTTGLGQTQLVQTFNVRAIVTADAPYYWFSEFNSWFGSEGYETRPFIIPGAIIGNSVTARMINYFATSTPTASFDFTTTLLITPFDPGVDK